MVDMLIAMSKQPKSGFYLDNLDTLACTIKALELQNKKTLLLGVSYALLDLIEAHTFKLEHTIIMETGGMKGRRKELIKQGLHEKLSKGFGVKTIHSEYGMTELLSQAYSKGNGIFKCPPLDEGSYQRHSRPPFKGKRKNRWYQCDRFGQSIHLLLYSHTRSR